MRSRISVLLILLCLLLSGISAVGAQEAPLKVVATYSILGDLIQNVAGDNIELTVLVGPDGDSHTYEPTPQDVVTLSQADIIFENGLEFETWLDDLYEASGSTAQRVAVSDGIAPLAFDEDDAHHHDDEITTLHVWEGDWISNSAFDVESFHEAFEAVVASTPELTADDVRTYFEEGYATSFDTFLVEEETVTFTSESGNVTCTYVYAGTSPVVQVEGAIWSNFETQDAGCAEYRYLLLNPPHAEEAGSSLHFHMLYGSTSFEEIAGDGGIWVPSLYPLGTDTQALLDMWLANARLLGLYVAGAYGIDAVITEEEQALLSSMTSAHDHDEEAHAETGNWVRLAVNDHESGVAHIIDLASGEVVATFELSARPTLYTSESGRYIYAVQTNGNVVNVIDSGVRQIWHDDHYDTEIINPRVLDFAATGSRPIHFVLWEDQVSIFNDGDGTVVIFNESDVFNTDAAFITITTARPHHGVGVAVGEVVMAGIPNLANTNDSLPVGVAVYTLDGTEVERFENCPGLHGEAHAGHDGMAFACSDGILIVSWHDGEFTAAKLDYPAGSGDLRAGTLHSAHDGQFILGNFGDNELIRIDYAAGTIERIQLPVEHWRFAVYEEDPAHAVVLTLDGMLHLIDIATGEIEGSVEVVEPFTRPTRGAARPVFALGGHYAYVSEPLPGDIAIVNLETLEVAEERIFVGGKPSSLAVFGLPGEDHHDDDHDHEHSHHHGEFDPHVWHDLNNALVMVQNIRDALAAADPANAAEYESNADAYIAQLQELDASIRELVATIPEANRILFTSHDTFGYFGDAYGFEVDSVLESVSTEAADPSAGAIAALVTEIRESGVPAIFAENIANPALIQQIASEAGVIVAPTLYTDALGQPGTAGETYLSMVRYNVETIAAALGGQN